MLRRQRRVEGIILRWRRLLGGAWLLALGAAACTGGVPPGQGADDEPGGGDEAGASGHEPHEGAIPTTSKACAGKGVKAGPSQWRRLTALQYRNTLKDLLGQDVDVALFLADTTTGRFTTNAGVATPDAQVLKYQDTAVTVAGRAVADLPKLLGCNPAAEGEDKCAAMFVDKFGARAWRRPLTEDDRKLLDAVYRAGKSQDFSTGIRLVLEAILQSPSFIYMVEFGEGASGDTARLTGHELATRLSYVLWNTMPDDKLTAAAAKGELKEADGLRAQAERLMSDMRFHETLALFHEQLFGIDQLSKPGGVVRDNKRYPQWSDTLTAAMRKETRTFVTSVFTDGEGTLSELLSAPYGFPTGPLVDLYRTGKDVRADGKTMFPDGSRRGILTQAATLSAAVPSDSLFRAVLRGKLLREQVFCEALPPVPGNVEFKQPDGAEQMTQQELLRAHQENPTCKSCHEQMDPLGFALENYDGIGRFRDKAEDGEAIDTSGTIVGTDVQGPFANTEAFIEKVASSHDVRGCFARQWFRFSLGRDPAEADVCTLAKTRDVLVQGGGNLKSALSLLVTSDAFRYRGGL